MSKNYRKEVNEREESTAATMRPNSKAPRKGSRGRGSKRRTYGTSDRSYSNDPAWYGSNAIAQSASNLFFSKRFGSVFRDVLPSDWETEVGNVSNPQFDYAIPGIMSLDLVPSFAAGYTETALADAPINVASQAIYSFVRHANSGSRNYDAPDLMTYLLAMSEVYSFINYLMRIYGYANTWFPENSYFPEAMLQAMHIRLSDVLGKMAQFCFDINVLISKATAFAVPAGMSYFTRKAFLYQNAWIESDNIKDQVYMFNPMGFYVYTIDDAHPEAYLKYKPLPIVNGFVDIDALINYGAEMITNLLNTEDIGICSGDVIKAYGSDLIKLSEMPTTYRLMPSVGDDLIFYQIRNASIVSYFVPGDLCQDDSKLKLDQSVYAAMTGATFADAKPLYLCCGDKILTSAKHDPTTDDVLESTRLMCVLAHPELVPEDGTVVADVICGTEVVVSVSMYITQRVRTTGATRVTVAYQTNQLATSSINQAIVSGFKHHPTLYAFSNIGNNNIQFNGYMQDFETVTTVDADELASIHSAVMLNMLAVPAIARL